MQSKEIGRLGRPAEEAGNSEQVVPVNLKAPQLQLVKDLKDKQAHSTKARGSGAVTLGKRAECW